LATSEAEPLSDSGCSVDSSRVAANRRNAARSTGPRSVKGKSRSSKNASKHGLLSTEPLLADESEKEFEGFRAGVIASLCPEGAVETLLAERVVFAAWRLRRLVRIEGAALERNRYQWNTGADQGLGSAFIGLCVNGDIFSKLSRYETAIERGLFKALHELERAQAVRAGRDVPLPIAVDVQVSSSTPGEGLGSFGSVASEIQSAPAPVVPERIELDGSICSSETTGHGNQQD
jgi:hypothetical protein